jgi:hypothetical protein
VPIFIDRGAPDLLALSICWRRAQGYHATISLVSAPCPRLGNPRIAKGTPLDQEWQGIAILSNGVWHTTTLAGCEGKPFANYIFGELDVPRLSQDKSAIPPFDMGRSMQLNPKNETVAQILAFIGSHLESVRKEIEKDDKERKRERDAKRLAEEASEIAKIINKDFDAWRHHVQRTLAKMAGGSDILAGSGLGGSDAGEVVIPGDEIPAILVVGGRGQGEGGSGDRGGGSQGNRLEPNRGPNDRHDRSVAYGPR